MADKFLIWLKSFRFQLIDEWHKAWKFWSVQFQTLGLLIMGAAEFLGPTWNSLPSWLEDRIPNAQTIGLMLFAFGIIARIFKQKD